MPRKQSMSERELSKLLDRIRVYPYGVFNFPTSSTEPCNLDSSKLDTLRSELK